jgi:hypothetical protein
MTIGYEIPIENMFVRNSSVYTRLRAHTELNIYIYLDIIRAISTPPNHHKII